MISFLSHSAEETIGIGYRIGKQLQGNEIICLEGDLAAGKTTLMKGIAAAAGVSQEQVNSPTFVYLNVYEGRPTVYHFDLYRLSHEEEFLHMGFDELFFAGGICCIEWAERIPALLPEKRLVISLTHTGEDQRQVVVEGL